MKEVARHLVGRRGLAAFAITGLGIGMLVSAPTASAAGPTASECRASALRALTPLDTIEPVVASADPGCTAENTGVLNPEGEAFALPGDLGSARALYASTDNDPGTAEAGVAQAVVTLPGAPVITATVLTSEAHVSCNGTTPVVTGDSTVASVSVGDTVIEVPPDGATFTQTVGPVTVVLNEKPETAGAGTFRALRVSVAGAPLELVIAESQVTPASDACQTGTDPCPQTPDPNDTECPDPCPQTPDPNDTECPDPECPDPNTDPCPELVDGWMTGGGTWDYGLLGADSASHGFTLPCYPPMKNGENLVINGDFGHFKLTRLDVSQCWMDPDAFAPENPDAGFNTMHGEGDTVQITIGDPSADCHLELAKTTFGGNHQAHSPNDPQPGTTGGSGGKGKSGK